METWPHGLSFNSFLSNSWCFSGSFASTSHLSCHALSTQTPSHPIVDLTLPSYPMHHVTYSDSLCTKRNTRTCVGAPPKKKNQKGSSKQNRESKKTTHGDNDVLNQRQIHQNLSLDNEEVPKIMDFVPAIGYQTVEKTRIDGGLVSFEIEIGLIQISCKHKH